MYESNSEKSGLKYLWLAISGFTLMMVKAGSCESKVCLNWLSGAIFNIIVMAISQMVITLNIRGFK